MTYKSQQNISRRHMIFSGLALGAVSSVPYASAGALNNPFGSVGAQLYTVRHALEADPRATLSKIRALGYDEVETINCAGLSAQSFKSLVEEANLKVTSGHISHRDWMHRPEAALDEVAAIGAGYAVLAWLAPEDRQDWKGLADKINQWALLAKARGLKMAYHNHDFEFMKTNEGLPFHVLMENTEPNLVTFELDCYWVSLGGHDPVHVLKKHGDRIRLLHLKDMKADKGMAPVGQGIIDFQAVLTAAKKCGVTNIYVEEDNAPDPFDSLAKSMRYLAPNVHETTK